MKLDSIKCTRINSLPNPLVNIPPNTGAPSSSKEASILVANKCQPIGLELNNALVWSQFRKASAQAQASTGSDCG